MDILNKTSLIARSKKFEWRKWRKNLLDSSPMFKVSHTVKLSFQSIRKMLVFTKMQQERRTFNLFDENIQPEFFWKLSQLSRREDLHIAYGDKGSFSKLKRSGYRKNWIYEKWMTSTLCCHGNTERWQWNISFQMLSGMFCQNPGEPLWLDFM